MADEPTKTALVERARELDIQGRSKMDADELQRAIAVAEAADDGPSLVDVAQDRAARREQTRRVIGSPDPIEED